MLILGGGSWFIVQLSRERAASDQARVRADRSRERAEDLLGFMIGDLREKLEPVGRLEVMDAVSEKAQESVTLFIGSPCRGQARSELRIVGSI